MAMRPIFDTQAKDTAAIRIAFVNAMPDSAFFETERQFAALVGKAAAAAGVTVRITLHCPQGIARAGSMQATLARRYRTVAALLETDRVDAVIVTGAAPRRAALEDEEFWPEFTRLFDWAAGHASALLASCLAAHAAAAHFDGIERIRLARKCSGIFSITGADAHPLRAGAPEHWHTPHSRFNTVGESALRSAGYHILGRSEAIGVDAFVRERSGMLLLGLNGHPEYAAGTLLGEYRRDVAAVLSGLSADYPDLPHALLDEPSDHRLRLFRAQVAAGENVGVRDFPQALAIRADMPATGSDSLLAGWLLAVLQRRPRPDRSRRTVAAASPAP